MKKIFLKSFIIHHTLCIALYKLKSNLVIKNCFSGDYLILAVSSVPYFISKARKHCRVLSYFIYYKIYDNLFMKVIDVWLVSNVPGDLK